MRSVFCLLCLANILIVPATSQASLPHSACAEELDQAVSIYEQGNAKSALTQLEQMRERCAHLPQVHHNLGVIAGRQNRWDEAEVHFHKAMANDTRTNMTVSHLQSMHQYRATQAYQAAFDVEQAITEPNFQMQKSDDVNASAINTDSAVQHDALADKTNTASNSIIEQPTQQTALYNEATIEYELYEWWNAASRGETDAWLEHYYSGYPPLENDDAQAVEWNNVKRDISFTQNDVVVLLAYTRNSIKKHSMLLMRLQGERWKIYKEADL